MGRTHVAAGRERFDGAGGKLATKTRLAQGYVGTYAEKNSDQPSQTQFTPDPVTDSDSASPGLPV